MTSSFVVAIVVAAPVVIVVAAPVVGRAVVERVVAATAACVEF
jgi:hypothetical protein